MATQRDVEMVLENASEDELTVLAYGGCQYANEHPNMPQLERQQWGCYMGMIAVEAERRKIEPLWRKAKRFAVRNSGTFKEIGKIAAVVTLGVVVGRSLTR
jgi:hypothetical protein